MTTTELDVRFRRHWHSPSGAARSGHHEVDFVKEDGDQIILTLTHESMIDLATSIARYADPLGRRVPPLPR